MITSFQVKNLRSIEDSGSIDLKKITVLVGRNSSGKSTILRSLPLLRQSVEQPTKGPLLWYGRLVDFGDFKNAVRDGDTRRGVTIGFGVTLSPRRRTAWRALSSQEPEWLTGKSGLRARVDLTIGRSAEDRVGHIRRIIISLDSDVVEVCFDGAGLIEKINVMGELVCLPNNSEWAVGRGKILPNLMLLEKVVYQTDEDEFEDFMEPAEQPFGYLIDLKLGLIAHGNTSPERIRSIAGRLAFAGERDFFQQLIAAPGVPQSVQHRLELIGPASEEVRALRRAVLLRHIDGLLRALDEEIDRFARAVRYIEPVRANAERYYREQDLAVDDIDSRGANTAVFLSSLDETSLKRLQQWMLLNFGFRVEVESGTGHIQIKISDGVSKSRNIADLGFGYSQLLPIILQLWRTTRIKAGEATPTLAIEQPELHLHPHFQAMLADVVVAAATSGPRRSSMFIETHSDHFINRLGALASEGKIDPKDIQIIIVSEDDFGDSVARRVNFDEDGTLSSNWPAGFFTPGLN